MNARTRRIAIFGLVILIGLVVGVVARREVMQREARLQPPAPHQTTAPAKTDAPASPEAPEAPQAAAPETASAATRPAFDVVRVEPDGQAVIAGRAAPGTRVELRANGGVVDRTTANDAGEFVMMPPPLQPGDHELTIKTPEAASRQSVVVSIPQPGKGQPLVVVAEAGKPSQVMQNGAALVPASPAEAAASQPPQQASAPADTPLAIAAVEAEGGRLFVQGTGTPGSRAMIYLNDAPLADAEVGPNGRWSLTVERGLKTGDYKVRVDQTDPDGKVVARAEVPFSSAEPVTGSVAPREKAPTAAAKSQSSADAVVTDLATIEVKRGDNLWRISRRAYGSGVRFSTIYEANTKQIRDPNRIYPGQVFVMPPGG